VAEAKDWRRVLSLGSDCQAQYQIRRYMRFVGTDRSSNRNGLGSPTTVFSWQVTPMHGLLLYLRQDFAGLFERDDLHVGEFGITHARTGTLHLHEFPRQSGEALAAHYSAARERHDRLCARTRLLLTDDEPTLLVLDRGKRSITADQLAEVQERLHHYNPSKSMSLLCLATPRPAHLDWRGDARAWSRALSAQLRPPSLRARLTWLLRRRTSAVRGELTPS
jgi:hypothetical protein